MHLVRSIPIVTLMTLAACVGCSGMTVLPIHNDQEDLGATGFRYYESSPYILVYSDGTSLKSNLIHLPDKTRKMSIKLFDFLSSNSMKLTFSNGVLTSSETDADSTAVPKAVIEAAKDVAVAAAKGLAAFSTVEPRDRLFAAPPPYLFKLIVDGKKTKLVAGRYVTGNGPLEIIVNLPNGGQE